MKNDVEWLAGVESASETVDGSDGSTNPSNQTETERNEGLGGLPWTVTHEVNRYESIPRTYL